MYVQESVYDQFVEEVKKHVADLRAKVGDPSKDGVEGGPLVSKSQRDKVWGFIQSGKDEGATVVSGGEQWNGQGFYIVPTGK